MKCAAGKTKKSFDSTFHSLRGERGDDMFGDIFAYVYQFIDSFAFLVLAALGMAIIYGMMGNYQHGTGRTYYDWCLCDGYHGM